MGHGQAVRHRILIPAFPGSIPGAPAIYKYGTDLDRDRSGASADLKSEKRIGRPRQREQGRLRRIRLDGGDEVDDPWCPSHFTLLVKGWLNFAAGMIQPFYVLPARKGR